MKNNAIQARLPNSQINSVSYTDRVLWHKNNIFSSTYVNQADFYMPTLLHSKLSLVFVIIWYSVKIAQELQIKLHDWGSVSDACQWNNAEYSGTFIRVPTNIPPYQ